MKTVVFQYSHKLSNLYNQAYADILEQNCRPTVVKYCKKYGYDYRFYPEYTNVPNIYTKYPEFNPFCAYFNIFKELLREDYDRYLFLDLDIVIEDRAPALITLSNPVGMVRQIDGTKTLNTGVILCDRVGAASIAGLLGKDLSAFAELKKFADQNLVNALLDVPVDELDSHWNGRPIENENKNYFTHYYRKDSKSILMHRFSK